MAGSSGTIGIRILLDGQRAVSRQLNAMSEDANRVGRAFADIAKAVPFGGPFLKAAGLATTALAGVAAAGVVAGIKTAASMEQANISFTTMLGSGQAAQSFLTDLQQFAAKTPFEFPELQTAASSLISAGIAAKDVIPIMTSLGNATSGMGTGSEGVQRATVALQQMSAAGRITGEDLNQLRDAGIPVFDLLAAATGKSKQEVANLAQAGKLGAKELDQLMGALKSGAGLERFSGLMDKQSESLSGLAATFKDTINMGLAQTVQPLIPGLKQILGYASTMASSALPKIQSGFASIMPTVQQLTDGIGALMGSKDFSAGGIGAAFSLSPETVTTLQNFMTTFTAGLAGIKAGLAPVWAGIQAAPVSTLAVVQSSLKWMADHKDAVSAMATSIALVTTAVTAARVATAAWALGLAIIAPIQRIITAVTAAQAAGQSILNAVMAANPIGLVVVALTALVAGVILAYKKSETFRTIVDGLGSALRVGFTAAVQGVTAAVKWLVEGFKDAWTWVKKLIDKISGLKLPSWLGGGGVVNSLTGGLLGDANPARANGGPVAGGKVGLVGERGPELFVPKVNGTIISNEALKSSLSGSLAGADGQPIVVHITSTLDGKVVAENTARHLSTRMARA